MLRELAALASGTTFGLGLAVSQMVNPAKVLAFLDIFGTWDPSLGLVMGGAVLITFIGYRWVLGRNQPILADKFDLPVSRAVNRQLLSGAVVFGIGWGLVGYCPGPALASLVYGVPQSFAFVAAMVVGAIAYHGPAQRLVSS